MLDDITNMTIV